MTTLSPYWTSTAPSACLAIRPVSMKSSLPPKSTDSRMIIGSPGDALPRRRLADHLGLSDEGSPDERPMGPVLVHHLGPRCVPLPRAADDSIRPARVKDLRLPEVVLEDGGEGLKH